MSDGAPISQEIRLPTDTVGVLQATARLDELIKRVDKMDHASERHHKKSESEWKGIGRSIDEAKKKSLEFFEFVGAVAAFEVLEKIADKFAEIGKEAVGAAAHAERMNMAINAAAGGERMGSKTRNWIEEYSKHSIFRENQNESAYLELKRHGVGQQSAGLFMKASEDLAAIANPDDAANVRSRALEALQHAHTMGRINARSVGELGITADSMRTLPRYQGIKSNAKVWEAAAKDNLDENEILNLIVKATGEKGLGGRGSDAAESLYTKMDKLHELPERFYKRLGESELTGDAAKTLDDILKRLDPAGPEGKRIMDGLTGAMTLAERFLEHLPGLIDGATKAMKVFGETTMIAMGPLGVAGLAVGARAAARPEERKAIDDGLSTSMYGKTHEQLEQMGFFGKAWQGTKGALHLGVGLATGGHYKPFNSEFDTAEHMAATGRSAGDGLAAGLEHGERVVRQAATEMAGQAESATRERLKTHSPSRVMEDIGAMAGEGFAVGLEDVEPRVKGAFDSTFRIPADSLAGFASAALPARLGRGDTNLTVTVNVAPSPGQDQTGLGEAIAAAVRREVTGLLERTNDE